MKNFFQLISGLWGKVFDQSENRSTKFAALAELLVLVLILVASVVLPVIFLSNAVPYIVGGAFLVYLFWGDAIEASIERHRLANCQQAVVEQEKQNAVYRNLAIAIVPAVSQVVSMPLEPEDIFYDRAIYPLGDGIYFATPRQLNEQECMKLRRLIVQCLFAKVGIPRQQMFEEGTVSVSSDYIFLRKMPQIMQSFST